MPYPVNTAALDEFSPENMQAKAESYAVSEVKAGADRLIETSPAAQEIKANYEYVDQVFLKGVPPLSLSDMKALVIAEAEEMGEEIIANVAKDLGLDLPIAEIQALARMDFDAVVQRSIELGKERLGELAIEAMAQLGIQSVSTYASKLVPFAGLYTVTKNALADGKITQGEAMSIGSTALSTAGTTLTAGAVATGVGILGSILAVPAMGVVYLEGEIEAQKKLRKAQREAARKLTNQQVVEINAFLNQARSEQILPVDEMLWERRDFSIGMVANGWEKLERRLGTSFELRFFPGTPPPLRAGWMGMQSKLAPDGLSWLPSEYDYLGKRLCESPTGCLYFPGSRSTDQLATTYKYWHAMSRENKLLAKQGLMDPENYVMSPYQVRGQAQIYGGVPYAYYWRTLRAFG